MLNIHHLELFYYVARHGGISEAVRNMPYGIQQPAVSSQIIQLEETLGLTLFQRRPFQLLPPGVELYQFVRPFFENLEGVEEKLRSGGRFQHVRIGAAEIILRDHLPAPLQRLKKKFPGLKVTLRSGYLPEIESWFQKQEIDFAVTLLDEKTPPGLNAMPLIKLQLGLLVPKASQLQSADELWRRDRIEETLISLPGKEPVARNFQEGLANLGVDWFPGIEVSSLDVLEAYVANGYGLGLTVIAPNAEPGENVRLLPLANFSPVTIGALWQGKLVPVTQVLLGELQERAKSLETPRRTGGSQSSAGRAK
jgi:DNA-binding transcriptional LysR family regulator